MAIQGRIREIGSEREYDSAIERFEALMDQGRRTPDEDDEYRELITIIGDYEDEHHQLTSPPDPVEVIKFHMERFDMTVDDLAPLVGSRTKATEVLRGKRGVTLKMNRALREHFGITGDRLTLDGEHPPSTPDWVDLDRFPAVEMEKRGWVPKASDPGGRIEETALDLIERAGGRNALPQGFLRGIIGPCQTATFGQQALRAWCLHVLGEARQAGLEGIHDPGTIDAGFLRDVVRLSSLDDGPNLAREKLAGHGIAMVVASRLPNTHLDGAALRTVEGVPVIGMTLRDDRIDNFWFCLLHELAHHASHFSDGSEEMFVDDIRSAARDEIDHRPDGREREADDLAREALIPSGLWSAHSVLDNPTPGNVRSLAREAGVHPAVVAGRVRFELKDGRILTKLLGSKKVRSSLIADDALAAKRW